MCVARADWQVRGMATLNGMTDHRGRAAGRLSVGRAPRCPTSKSRARNQSLKHNQDSCKGQTRTIGLELNRILIIRHVRCSPVSDRAANIQKTDAFAIRQLSGGANGPSGPRACQRLAVDDLHAATIPAFDHAASNEGAKTSAHGRERRADKIGDVRSDPSANKSPAGRAVAHHSGRAAMTLNISHASMALKVRRCRRRLGGRRFIAPKKRAIRANANQQAAWPLWATRELLKRRR